MRASLDIWTGVYTPTFHQEFLKKEDTPSRRRNLELKGILSNQVSAPLVV